MESKVKLLSVPLKQKDNIEKVRRRILRYLQKNEKCSSNLSNLQSIEGIDAVDVQNVESNSQYLVFLMKDGRVCRMKCSSQSKLTEHHIDEEITRRSRDTSFQVLSDAEYARQLQSQFDQERSTRGSLGGAAILSVNEISPYVAIPDIQYQSSLNTNFSYTPSSPGYSPTSPPGFYTSSSPVYSPSSPVPKTQVDGTGAGLHGGVSESTKQSGKTSSEKPSAHTIVPRSLGVRFSSFLSENKDTAKQKKEKDGVWPKLGELEWLIVKQNPDSLSNDSRFSAISTLHSEILLVGAATGRLYTWSCKDGVINPQPHPLEEELGLVNEKIVKISSCAVRASLVTESGGVVTFYDSLLRGCLENGVPPLVSSLSHPLTQFSELSNDPVHYLYVSEFITYIITKAGRVYWWGLCPQGKSAFPSTSHTPSSHSSISDGSLVRLKNGPPCGPNALVLQCSKTHGPRIGHTVNIMEHSSLDPMTTLLVRVMRNTFSREDDRVINMHELDSSKSYESLEVWQQSDVVFLDDSPAVLGRVVAVDNNQAIVDISHTETPEGEKPFKTSLKVLRLSELEPCVSTDINGSSKLDKTNSEGKSSTSGPTQLPKKISRHVAGIVQHYPVCLIDPTLNHTPQLSSPEDSLEGGLGRIPLTGFTPLNLYPTNDGPYLLLKRIVDGQTYFLCSSHMSSGLLQSSSFVALSGVGQKPPKCTVIEEGCDSIECGLELHDSAIRQKGKMLSVPKGSGGKVKGKGRKRKLAQRDIDISPELSSQIDRAFFIDLYDSEILCLKDINGIPIPIPPGLRMRPVEHRSPDPSGGWSPEGQGKQIKLSNAYKAIISNQYTVTEKNKKVLLLAIVPQMSSLMSTVLLGDYEKVERMLSAITSSTHSSEVVGQEVSAKRVNVITPSEEVKPETDVTMDTEPSEIQDGKPDLTSQMSVDVDVVPDGNQSDSSGLSLESLYDCTTHNCNILHVCAGSDLDDEEEDKSCFRAFLSDSLRYQSITIQPEYRHMSFEELRYKNKDKPFHDNNDMKKQGEALNHAHFMMLELFLSCEAVRSDVNKLLCQKNSFGETPFMAAISHQNIKSALKMYRFVEQHLPDSFESAIIPKNREGLSPLHMLLASYCTCYDSLNMKLYISSMPVGYTAQQLLSLFKEYYPSVYRAEVTRDTDVEDGVVPEVADESSEEGSDTDSDDHTTLTGGFGNSQRPGGIGRSQNNGTVDSSVPLRGVVYFSDIHQLRAAHLEMQDFRVFSNYNSSRGGSFGQTHSVSFLNIGLEPEECSEIEGNNDGHIPNLLDMGHGIVSRIGPHRRGGGGLRTGGWGSSGRCFITDEMREEARKKKATATLPFACRLVCAFLERCDISAEQDVYGETCIQSIVHNPRCIQSLKEIAVPYSPSPPPVQKPEKSPLSQEATPIKLFLNKPLDIIGSIPSVTAAVVSTTLSNLLSGSDKPLGTTGLGIFGTQLTTPTPVTSSVTPISTDNTTTQTSLWRPFGPDCSSSISQPLRFGKSDSDEGTQNESNTVTSLAKSNTGTSLTSSLNPIPSSNTSSLTTIETVTVDNLDVSTNDAPLKSEKPPDSPPLEVPDSPEEPCGTCGLYTHDDVLGYDLLRTTFRNWPCIVTSVLGFNPFPFFNSSSTPRFPRFSSIKTLDSFVVNLFINCDSGLIGGVSGNIIDEMNKSLKAGEDIKTVDIHGNLEGMNENNVSLYVGVRFLGSLIRALIMEHSRVKSSVAELQLSREGRSQTHQHQMRSRIVLQVLKNTIMNFSWLAIEGLAKAAETCSVPVRLGVAKPFGASSVTNEYQTSRVHSSFRFAADRNSGTRSLARQLHVRSALNVTDSQTGQSEIPILPVSGLRLIPQHRKGGVKEGEGGDQDEFGMDLSDSDVPISETNDSFEGRGSQGYSRMNMYGTRTYSPTNDIMVDFADNSSSDEDDPFDTMGIGLGRRGNDRDGDGMGDIYPYAWALDGRRIGENTPVVRPSSPTSSFFGHGEVTTPLCTIPSIRFGAGFLSRTFARIVKDLVDMISSVTSKKPSYYVELPPDVNSTLAQSTVSILEHTWSWLCDVLDVAEGQLQQGKKYDTQRYVATLRGSARPSSPSHGSSVVQRIITRTASKSFIGSTPGEYITYLLRCQSQEYDDCLPVMDLYGYEHVVYMLDGLLYTLNHWPKAATELCKIMQSDPGKVTSPSKRIKTSSTGDETMETEKPQETRFFSRSESIIISEEVQKSNDLFFDTATSPVPTGDPLQEAFPLARQPHLLQPYARKEQLFNSPRPLESSEGKSMEGICEEGEKEGQDNTFPSCLPLSYLHLKDREIQTPITLLWSMDKALQRWNISVSVFAHIFLAEGPGSERANFLNNRAGFASRMARFRHQVTQLFDSIQSGRSDWASVSNTLSLRVRRDHLLEDALEFLGHMTKFHYSQIRVKFEGEDGSGPGVNRGFFASLANAIKLSDTSKPPCNKVGSLFHQPGKEPEQSGLYSPRPFVLPSGNSSAKNNTLTSQRKLVFRAIGRFLGLCFWFKHTIPFMVCRHVAKYLLERELAWHDLAFFNADLYEGLRRMMMDAKSEKSKEEFQATYCCYFEAPIAGQKLTGQNPEPVFKDLIPGGSKIAVTPDRVQEYVRLYAMFVMVGCVKDELQAMKNGLTDVIPPELLSGLTAEDFQLLLSGDSANISLQRVRSVMKFNHTHGRPPNICDRFEKMYWRVVGHMNNTQRQQLLYFATGSASLPASSDQEPSSVSITIDVIGGSNIEALPVASTCSQRMSIPLYPSYHTLKKKLMQAIQCQAYGLG